MGDAVDADADVRRRLSLLIGTLVVVGLMAISCPGAQADDCAGQSGSSATHVTTSVTGILLNGEEHAADEASCGVSSVSNPAPGPQDSGLDALCVREALSQSRNPFAFCDLPPTAAVPAMAPALTPGLVARAFRRLDLPASELIVQPPNGRTLVNFDTNFYTEQPGFERTVTLLGRRVDLRIWPSQFRWVFGDGSEFPSTSAGAPYPDLLITHNYLQRGEVSPRVDTTYSARFRVDGGAWRDVDGTVTIPGEPVQLDVVTARPVLVGY
jgi:hypothetical protein